MTFAPDAVALREILERQLALLVPTAEQLAELAARPPLLPANAWRGPAADRCREVEAELAERVREAALAAEDGVRRVRLVLGALP